MHWAIWVGIVIIVGYALLRSSFKLQLGGTTSTLPRRGGSTTARRALGGGLK